jgi:hypothetical protein
MCNHLNLKILIHIFTIIYLIMIIIIMRCENFVAHQCAAEHRLRINGLEERHRGRVQHVLGLVPHLLQTNPVRYLSCFKANI